MACEAGQGCGSGGGCGTDWCGADSSCSRTEPTLPGNTGFGACIKCKDEAPHNEPLCATCLHTVLLSKFKTAVNKNSLVMPSDNVLLSFSGGPCSRVALEFLREIRLKAQTDMDASRDQGQSVFKLGVVFVNEATASRNTSLESQSIINEVRSSIFSENDRMLPLHIQGLEDAFKDEHLRPPAGLCKDEDARSPEQKLDDLLGSVEDTTGKEDLVTYLRMQVLQQVAKKHGYTKLALGLCTSRIAARSVAATAKGQGYSFPADVQYVDTRWPVPVVLPLRDCLARELISHCRLANLKTSSAISTLHIGDPTKSINKLSQTFVSLLQQNLSREYTITRTMGKLRPFKFNTPPASPVELALRRRQNSRRGIGNPKADTLNSGSFDPEPLCAICSAPLDPRDFCRTHVEDTSSSNEGEHNSTVQIFVPNQEGNERGAPIRDGEDIQVSSLSQYSFISVCCPSCKFQVLPKRPPNAEKMYVTLPAAMRERALANLTDRQKWMRSQIQGFLLSDD